MALWTAWIYGKYVKIMKHPFGWPPAWREEKGWTVRCSALFVLSREKGFRRNGQSYTAISYNIPQHNIAEIFMQWVQSRWAMTVAVVMMNKKYVCRAEKKKYCYFSKWKKCEWARKKRRRLRRRRWYCVKSWS